ncbi:MAG TPA: hypothetical protein VFG62_15900 [Rhodopila sp.]|nr:hypothetical protein [Rhodopila sp.]
MTSLFKLEGDGRVIADTLRRFRRNPVGLDADVGNRQTFPENATNHRANCPEPWRRNARTIDDFECFCDLQSQPLRVRAGNARIKYPSNQSIAGCDGLETGGENDPLRGQSL